MVLDDYTDEELMYYESEDSGYESDRFCENKIYNNKIKTRYNLIYIVNRVILNKRIINFINSKKLFYDNINMSLNESENEIRWECYNCGKLLEPDEEYCTCLEDNSEDEIEIIQEKDPPKIIENKKIYNDNNNNNKCFNCEEEPIIIEGVYLEYCKNCI